MSALMSAEVIHWLNLPSPFGSMLIAISAKGLCRLSFDEGEELIVAVVVISYGCVLGLN